MLQEFSSLHIAFAHVCLEVILEYWFLQTVQEIHLNSRNQKCRKRSWYCWLSLQAFSFSPPSPMLLQGLSIPWVSWLAASSVWVE